MSALSQLIVASPDPQGGQHQCGICLNDITPGMAVCTAKCQAGTHGFCFQCLEPWFRNNLSCPSCRVTCGPKQGDCPEGIMTFKTIPHKLPGFNCCSIEIRYIIPSGIQDQRHPNPGEEFNGTMRNALLPCNDNGFETLRLLKKAFDNKLIFKVGTSLTSGEENTVCWGTIHHKTEFTGTWGWPDTTYFQRVKDECNSLGIF